MYYSERSHRKEFRTKTHELQQNEDGTFNVFRDLTGHYNEDCGISRIDLESLKAESISQLEDGTLMVKNGNEYSLYATERFRVFSGSYHYGGVYKFIDGILEYISVGDVILYKTAEGWFFLFGMDSFYEIGYKNKLEKRINQIPKLCDADTKILECKSIDNKAINQYPEIKAYMVTTSKDKVILYRAEHVELTEKMGHAVHITRYSEIPGYLRTVKLYPNASRKFFLAPLDSQYSYMTSTWYKSELVQSVTYLGNGYLLAKNGEESKLFFCEDGVFPKTVVDWGKHSITKLETNFFRKSIICTKWSIDDGKYTRTIEDNRQLLWWGIPEYNR